MVYTDPPIADPVRWFDERGKLNPFSPWIAANVGAHLLRFHEVVGAPAVFRRTPFYREFAKAEGWDKGLSVMFWRGEEMLAMFSLYRGLRQPEFTEAEVEEILALGRHIEIAVARVSKIDRDQNFRSALQAFTRTLPAPLLLLDWEAKLFFANTAAYESAALWNHGGAKARRYNPRDCFVVPTAVMEGVQRLKDEIQGINPRELADRMPAPVVIDHPREAGLQASVSPVHFGRSTLARPGFFVLFKEPLNLGDPLPPAVLAAQKARALAVLSPAEREVVSHLLTGASNAQIAAARNKSVLTIKTQVNSIFSKLGIKSRAQLVARLK
jgi:DNA-binding CsgD family transcriptional regulator